MAYIHPEGVKKDVLGFARTHKLLQSASLKDFQLLRGCRLSVALKSVDHPEDKIVRESLHDIDVVVDLDSAMYDMFEWDATGRIGWMLSVQTPNHIQQSVPSPSMP